MDQLAEKVGVTKSSISQWESGKIENLTSGNLLKLADELEVSARWIWLWKETSGSDIPMGRPQHLEPDESALVDTFKLLEPQFRDALLADANKYLGFAAPQQPSRANPYPKAMKARKSTK